MAYSDEVKRSLVGVPEELLRAKENLKGRLLLSLESTSNRMTRLGKAIVVPTTREILRKLVRNNLLCPLSTIARHA